MYTDTVLGRLRFHPPYAAALIKESIRVRVLPVFYPDAYPNIASFLIRCFRLAINLSAVMSDSACHMVQAVLHFLSFRIRTGLSIKLSTILMYVLFRLTLRHYQVFNDCLLWVFFLDHKTHRFCGGAPPGESRRTI